MPQTKRGLGKGISALISDKAILKSLEIDEAKGGGIQKINITAIYADDNQPRKKFSESSMSELADSIKHHGVIQPIIVTKIEQNKYSIIAGERRWRAAKIAGLDQMPVIVRTTTEMERLEVALLENVQREDLTPLEQALSIQRLHEQFSQSYEQIAKKLGKAYPTIINMVRLLQLPENMQKLLHEGKVTEGHARQLLALKDRPELQQALLSNILEKHWSVRQAEQFVADTKARNSGSKTEKPVIDSRLSGQLSNELGVKSVVRRTSIGGHISIDFKNEEELKSICKKFNIDV